MLSDGRDVITLAPWVEIFPGLALAVVVLGFNLVGDGLRRRLDPRGMAR
jgi:peptide/nickel transport system permease protein